ncbi:MAG: FkbM family methyltransferase [Gemmatimonadetes bacterium]|nr:FkbM family methyltransferase [Gemmatimonadota bacterium]MYC91109.1 FkbM family methyltransferase [Gemmatimonadota bacterium]MYG35532.1 FkbM family methyltransferase [Gemmatimonadota bacterium]MYJ17781.1 FkbM family methyltransferase [Gemmatimonadota bacterium]
MGRSEGRAADPFGEGSAWGDCLPAGLGAFWLGVARSFPGGWPWSRFALLARRAARRHLSGPVDTRLWGHRLRLFPDRSISEARILFLPRSWDRAERRRIARWIRPGFTFVDVGANVGAYSFWILSRIDGTGRVVTVEPNPDLARQLRYNVHVNGVQDRMRAVQAAVGAARGRGLLAVETRNSGEGRLVGTGEATDGTPTVPVRVVTLADIVEEAGLDRIDCLKVDVEGGEADVLRPFLHGAPRSLWPRHLVVELGRGPLEARRSADLPTWLAERGYRLEIRTRLNGVFSLA